MFTFRHYQSGDEKAIVELWNKTLKEDPITPKRFSHLVLLDANFDPVGLRLAFVKEKLIGVVYAVRRLVPLGVNLETDNGWIPFFFVAEDYQKQDVASKLFHDAEFFLQELGRTSVFFASYAPNYILPGLDEEAYPSGYQFLLKQGFQKLYSPVAMDRSLIKWKPHKEIEQLKALRESEGFSFKQLENQDIYEIILFANQQFNPDWGRAIREGLLQGLPMGQVLVIRFKGEVVGFCMYGGYEGIAERFGPFGVAETMQGKGLGKILLQDCLQQMRSEGLHHAWFLWTSEKSAAGHLYLKAGFSVTRRFHVMKKELT
ncbi:GNAT family N-acetyltransferase [Alkalihalobacillus pseudalcaliphilus]|uniref:GNAT family N-acetyltransferase n=1 Tax=Alkalihalobacillus pseudalcaliphilus TaxID=79884 RepID=UPI00064DA87E|nr:GNAT family N-acetyltransferase [Alkalihalobacillus pseudalcaliphilus]KMK74993.1 acetyltransferase [Alkalihalobacillus pseudalcaliphilus]